jgi:tRNA-splicing ligase RtcB
MLTRESFHQIEPFAYEIPMSFREDMRVPARLYADEVIFENAFGDRSLEQLINTTTLPGVVRYSVAMPDIHQGYGPPIGAVIPIDPRNNGVISPGATGYDINCGVRLLRSQLVADELAPYMISLVDQLYQAIPSGMGHGSSIKLSDDEMEGVLHDGAAWVIRHYSGERDELACIEEHGTLGDADATMVTSAAKKRGHDQQ